MLWLVSSLIKLRLLSMLWRGAHFHLYVVKTYSGKKPPYCTTCHRRKTLELDEEMLASIGRAPGTGRAKIVTIIVFFFFVLILLVCRLMLARECNVAKAIFGFVLAMMRTAS